MKSHSLYIHVPFCARKCLFCSFVIAVAQEHRREEYVNALKIEMKKYKGVQLQSIYLGGGTPSILDEEHFDTLMQEIRKNFLLQDDIEITIEANPESISLSKAKFLKGLKFNRISLGVQSLNNRYLKFLGRNHDRQTAIDAYQNLRQTGWDNISLDLMYAFPGQTTAQLEDDVHSICQFNSEHLSLYTLTIEPNSRFYTSQLKLDDDDKLSQHYLMVARILNEYGFKQYEISNFAKPQFESRHNKNYWLGTPYIGIGVGAHGFDGRRRWWNTSNFQDYLKKINSEGKAVEGFEDLTESQLIMEKVLLGLRMNEGIAWDLIPASKQEQIASWIKDGLLWREGQVLKVTDQGRLVLDELSSRLI